KGRIDPEELLVAAATVKPSEGYISVDDIDEGSLRGSSSSNAGEHDKVFVSTLIRLTDSTCACTLQTIHVALGSVPLGNAPALYSFSNILTGALKKHMHAAVAQGHVHAAMEGYNALIFVYGPPQARLSPSAATLTSQAAEGDDKAKVIADRPSEADVASGSSARRPIAGGEALLLEGVGQ
ncbi:hypothetical protein FIBSPDRAFT_873601, partial [Athelia psychrophila]